MATKIRPEIRQCDDPKDFQFGCSATKNHENGRYMVANPLTGGHWAYFPEVENWPIISEESEVELNDDEESEVELNDDGEE